MKSLILTLAALVAVGFASGSTAQATVMEGSQSFTWFGTTVNGVSNGGITTANSTIVLSPAVVNGSTGDFSGYTPVFPTFTSIDPISINTINLANFSMGSVDLGYFTTNTFTDVIGTNTRTFTFLGAWTPGTNGLFAGKTPNPDAQMLIQLNQVGGPGTSTSGGATLNFATVPEPGSLTLALGCLGVGAVFYRRQLFAKKS
jgi:hypothetical protein